jgi:hypothetical protein
LFVRPLTQFAYKHSEQTKGREASTVLWLGNSAGSIALDALEDIHSIFFGAKRKEEAE